MLSTHIASSWRVQDYHDKAHAEAAAAALARAEALGEDGNLPAQLTARGKTLRDGTVEFLASTETVSIHKLRRKEFPTKKSGCVIPFTRQQLEIGCN